MKMRIQGGMRVFFISLICEASSFQLSGSPVPPAHASRIAMMCEAGATTEDASAVPSNTRKDAILSITLDGLAVDQARRTDVNEMLVQLESTNPTGEPARSPLLNGVWQLNFAGAPGPGLIDSPTRELALALYSTGYSAGALLQFIGKLPAPLSSNLKLDSASVTIMSSEAGQPRVVTEAQVSLMGSSQTLRLSSNLVPVSNIRLREEAIELTAFGQTTLLPGPLARSRQLFVTYLDEELLVVRDESGVPDILTRKDKFVAVEPSFADDDLSPGAS